MNAQIGQWESGGQPHVVAVHMALLRTGKVLLFTGDEENTYVKINIGKSHVWDPATKTDTSNTLSRNLFCCGHAFLPDGRLLVIGGQSMAQTPLESILSMLGLAKGADHDVHTFDPVSEKWARYADMPRARWYPTCTTLPDGKVLITSGFAAHAWDVILRFLKINLSAVNEDYELFDPVSNQRSPRQLFWKGIRLYPFVHVLPGGTLFVHSENKTRLWNLNTRAWLPGEFTNVHPGTRTYNGMGSCVHLPIQWDGSDLNGAQRSRLLIVGGSTQNPPNHDTPATDTAEIFEFDPQNPANSHWRETARMAQGRFMSDTVLLPDGTVFMVNGAGKGQSDHNHDAIRSTAIFDPITETWQPMADLGTDRLYHATAILLPDARVLVGGSTGHDFPQVDNEFRLEIFSPPYLFKGARPTITHIPSEITYGAVFNLETPQADQIASAVLVRPSAVTHNNNMDQRLIRLGLQNQGNNRLRLNAPVNGTVAAPGYYMLFLVNTNGIPSVARFVQLR